MDAYKKITEIFATYVDRVQGKIKNVVSQSQTEYYKK